VEALDVLDIGSGYGHTALALARRCRSVVGIEPSLAVARQAQQEQQAKQVHNVAFVHQTLEAFQTERHFDLIILDNVLEHLPDQPATLARIAELLRPGGVLYIVVPNKWWPVEVHYRLPFLGWLPLRLANFYLRISGKGRDYTDASYAPGFIRMVRLMNERTEWTWRFATPANLAWTTAGAAWHYQVGVGLLKRCSLLWALSKAFLIVAKKKA
jgi:2-polyprenyl-3-methyl-5-hydroxy-6-metoxy-1,4-benzoquinol methylase